MSHPRPSVSTLAALACAALVCAAPAAAAPGTAAGPRELLGPRPAQTLTPAPGGWLRLSTVPARRASEAIGINLDTWRTSGAYTAERWPRLMASLKRSGITRARVDVHLVGHDTGTRRQVEMGKAGIKLDVILGDAFGRYSATPLDRVFAEFASHVLPYAEAVEGSNEPDLSGNPDWASIVRAHQAQIVRHLSETPGAERLAVFAPATGRPNNQAALGDLRGLADYANAHAYSAGHPGGYAYDHFLAQAQALLPGAPTVVTETGFHTATEGTYSQRGVPEAIAARYAPKALLDAIRRGLPRTYLFDLVDRFDDPDRNRVEAHFGLLRVDGTPKPAFGAVTRLMEELRDPAGRSAPATAPVQVRPRTALPADVRAVGLRHSDGSLVLALWRERSLYDLATGRATPAPAARVRLALGERYLVARTRELATGRTGWQFPYAAGLDLAVGDDVTVVRLSGRVR